MFSIALEMARLPSSDTADVDTVSFFPLTTAAAAAATAAAAAAPSNSNGAATVPFPLVTAAAAAAATALAAAAAVGNGLAAFAAAAFCAAVMGPPPPFVRLRLCWYACSSEIRPPLCAHLHLSVACQWFLMAFSGRPGRSFASAAHRVPSIRWPSTRMRSSSAVHSPRRMSGLRWFSHLSRHCFPRRPSILFAMKLHFLCPCSSTRRRSWLSSSSVHCCVAPLNGRCDPEPPGVRPPEGLAPSTLPPGVLASAPSSSAPTEPPLGFFGDLAAAFAAAFAARAAAAFACAGVCFLAPAPFFSDPARSFRSSLDAACARWREGAARDRGEDEGARSGKTLAEQSWTRGKKIARGNATEARRYVSPQPRPRDGGRGIGGSRSGRDAGLARAYRRRVVRVSRGARSRARGLDRRRFRARSRALGAGNRPRRAPRERDNSSPTAPARGRQSSV